MGLRFRTVSHEATVFRNFAAFQSTEYRSSVSKVGWLAFRLLICLCLFGCKVVLWRVAFAFGRPGRTAPAMLYVVEFGSLAHLLAAGDHYRVRYWAAFVDPLPGPTDLLGRIGLEFGI